MIEDLVFGTPQLRAGTTRVDLRPGDRLTIGLGVTATSAVEVADASAFVWTNYGCDDPRTFEAVPMPPVVPRDNHQRAFEVTLPAAGLGTFLATAYIVAGGQQHWATTWYGGTVALEPRTIGPAVERPGVVRSTRPVAAPGSEFAGFRFPPEVITLAVRWYLRFGLSYRDVEELLAERGVEVDHTTLFRWVVRFTPLFVEAARPCRPTPGDRWFVDETYVKVCGRWRYLYRAVDQFGQVIDVLVSPNRDQKAARRFCTRALAGATAPVEVTTDRAPAYPRIVEDMLPGAQHITVRFANNRVEADHGRLKARLRPTRGIKTDRSLRIVATGHAFIQNLRRGHYELGTEAGRRDRVAAAFTELALAI